MDRNILTIREPDNLSPQDRLLYDPYKNIVDNFYKLAVDRAHHSFDPIAREFNGINRANEAGNNYYEAMLDVTSYFQASKGGRGKYIEKKLASAVEHCSSDYRLSELPQLINHTNILREKKLSGNISAEDRRTLNLCDWDFIGENGVTDLCSIFKQEGLIAFLELKNRVDSGGVGARREIYSIKFKKILEHFIKSDKIFRHQGNDYTLLETYKALGIKKIQLGVGILFDTKGELATLDSDMQASGFYAGAKDGINELHKLVKGNSTFELKNYDESKQTLLFSVGGQLCVEIRSVYGDEISTYLYHHSLDIRSLLKNEYDDIWLFQLLAISERENLLKHSDNATNVLVKALNANLSLRKDFMEFISSDGQNVAQMIDLSQNCHIDTNLIPTGRDKTEYLLDVLYFIASCSNEF